MRKRTSSGLVEGVTNTTASLPPSPELPKNNLVPARRTWLHIVTSPMLRGGWWRGLFACPCTSHDIHRSGQVPGLGRPPEGSVYNLFHNLTYTFTTIHYFRSTFGYLFFLFFVFFLNATIETCWFLMQGYSVCPAIAGSTADRDVPQRADLYALRIGHQANQPRLYYMFHFHHYVVQTDILTLPLAWVF